MGMNDEVILNSESNTVTLSKEEYAELMAKSEKLDALMNHGVDNWDGYDDAMDELNTTDGE